MDPPWVLLCFDAYANFSLASKHLFKRETIGEWIVFRNGWRESFIYAKYFGYMRWFNMMELRLPVLAVHSSEYEDDPVLSAMLPWWFWRILFPTAVLGTWWLGYAPLLFCLFVTTNEGRALSTITWLWTPPKDITCVPVSMLTQEGNALFFENAELRNPVSVGDWDYGPLFAALNGCDIIMRRTGVRAAGTQTFAAGRRGTPECIACEEFACDYACVPCGHLCLCGPCASRLNTEMCPFCHASFSKLLRVLPAE